MFTKLLGVFLLSFSVSGASNNVKASINRFTFPAADSTAYPEGVAYLPNSPYFFTGSTRDGTIYRGSLSSPDIEPFIPGNANRTAVWGMKIIPPSTLILAGGYLGKAWVYNIHTKKLLHQFTNGLGPEETFINDVGVDEGTGHVYLTDSVAPKVWRISAQQLRSKAVYANMEEFKDLSGIPGATTNGVVIVEPKKYAIIGDYGQGYPSPGSLYRLDLRTKDVVTVQVKNGGNIASPDGLLYKAPYLYIINGGHQGDHDSNFIPVVKLAAPFLSAEVLRNITNPLLFEAATASWLDGKKEFLVSNFQGFVDPPRLPFEIARIPAEL